MKIGPQYKISRMVGDRIFPKCQTTKFAISGTKRRSTKRPPRPKTEYGLQLLEKQKARFSYCMTERQFSRYVKESQVAGKENPSLYLYQKLESRLDNVLFRMGLVPSRLFARQVVAHGHIQVNGRRMSIPSYQVRQGDVISVRGGSKVNGIFKNIEERNKGYVLPEWLSADFTKLEGAVRGTPGAGHAEANINFGTIIEFYSRV